MMRKSGKDRERERERDGADREGAVELKARRGKVSLNKFTIIFLTTQMHKCSRGSLGLYYNCRSSQWKVEN